MLVSYRSRGSRSGQVGACEAYQQRDEDRVTRSHRGKVEGNDLDAEAVDPGRIRRGCEWNGRKLGWLTTDHVPHVFGNFESSGSWRRPKPELEARSGASLSFFILLLTISDVQLAFPVKCGASYPLEPILVWLAHSFSSHRMKSHAGENVAARPALDKMFRSLRDPTTAFIKCFNFQALVQSQSHRQWPLAIL